MQPNIVFDQADDHSSQTLTMSENFVKIAVQPTAKRIRLDSDCHLSAQSVTDLRGAILENLSECHPSAQNVAVPQGPTLAEASHISAAKLFRPSALTVFKVRRRLHLIFSSSLAPGHCDFNVETAGLTGLSDSIVR